MARICENRRFGLGLKRAYLAERRAHLVMSAASATSCRSRSRRRSEQPHSRTERTRAFTLLEVLLSIAIIALVASVLIGGSVHLLTEEPATLEQVFWKSVQETRKHALKAEHEMRLKYDAEKKQFVIVDGLAPARLAADGVTKEEAAIKTFPVPPASGSDVSVDLLSAGKSGAMVLIGGVLMESESLKYVTFYPDGTCSPFRLQIARASGAYTLNVDPWTCAPMLTPADPNAPTAP